MNNDSKILDEIIGIGSKEPISGPWRLSIYDTDNSGNIYVFSEEHSNDGSCSENRHFSEVVKEILEKTENTHILIENFVHVNDVESLKGYKHLNKVCSPVENGILNNLRNCMEIMKLNDQYCKGTCENRIHSIDPRIDMVSVLPDGKLFEAITHYCEFQANNGDFNGAVLTVYESLIHPMVSLLPDRVTLRGRLVGIFEKLKSQMNNTQGEIFDKIWKKDITDRIVSLNKAYTNLQKKYPSSSKSVSSFISDIESMKKMYKVFTDKFLDIFLLAHIFLIKNTGKCTGMIIYNGSLHSLQIEKYLEEFGFKRLNRIENGNLDACLKV